MLGSAYSFPRTKEGSVNPHAHAVLTISLGNSPHVASMEALMRISTHVLNYLYEYRSDLTQEYILDSSIRENKLLILLGAPDVEEVNYWYNAAVAILDSQRVSGLESLITDYTGLSSKEIESSLKTLGDHLKHRS